MSELLRVIPLFPFYAGAPEAEHYQSLHLNLTGAFEGNDVRFVTIPIENHDNPKLATKPGIIKYLLYPADRLGSHTNSRLWGVLDVKDEYIEMEKGRGNYGYATQAEVTEMIVFCDALYSHHLPEGTHMWLQRVFEENEKYQQTLTGSLVERGRRLRANMERLNSKYARELEIEDSRVKEHDLPLEQGVLTIDYNGKLHPVCASPITNSHIIKPAVGSFRQNNGTLIFSLDDSMPHVFDDLFQAEQTRREAFRARYAPQKDHSGASGSKEITIVSKSNKKLSRNELLRKRRKK